MTKALNQRLAVKLDGNLLIEEGRLF